MITKLDLQKNYFNQFLGLSTDEKPTEDVEENAIFLELDTGSVYYFSNGAWEKVPE